MHHVTIEQWHGDTIELQATRMVASEGAYAFDTPEGPRIISVREVRNLTTELIEEVTSELDDVLDITDEEDDVYADSVPLGYIELARKRKRLVDPNS